MVQISYFASVANQQDTPLNEPPKSDFMVKFVFFLAILFMIIIVITSSIGDDSSSSKEKNDSNGFFTFATPIPEPTNIRNICNKANAQYLPAYIEVTPAVYVTRTVEVQPNYIVTTDRIITDMNGKPATPEQIKEFKLWVASRGIALIPTNRSYEELKAGKFDIHKDQVPIEKIGQVMEAYEALKMLPDSIIKKMKGTAIYMSTVNDNTNYALYAHSSPDEIAKMYKDNPSVVRNGIFLVQPLSKRVTIHEIGHLIGTIGIEGLYGEEYSTYNDLRSDYKNIFYMQGMDNLPCGYITEYSLTNDNENFADHFSYYVTYGPDFRKRAESDLLLKVKYDFLRDKIFEGKEY